MGAKGYEGGDSVDGRQQKAARLCGEYRGRRIQVSWHYRRNGVSGAGLLDDLFDMVRSLKMKIADLIERDLEKLNGTPVFPGTRVPISYLFDCLNRNGALETFLQEFPSVSREQALTVLEASKNTLLSMREDRSPDRQPHLQVMHEAVNDELFLADLNAAMEDFKIVEHVAPQQ